MRVLAMADTTPDLGRPIAEFVVRERIDVVITAGDLSRYKLAGIEKVTVPTVGVYGNHCDGRYLAQLGITDLHLTSRRIGDLTFGGLQGCVRYKKRGADILYTQAEYDSMVAQLPAVDVLVTHCPPRGINDHDDPAHVGIAALRLWVDRQKPKVLIHGHTYPERPVTACGPTRIEYVFGARVITI
ncbi:metallophosphoesterase family protein [Mycolicibacterium nivoides]|uniref:Metallophosphoesterase family protein n=1 Tax=Mycolicibacterium nivoides TaxID=2487344 RepID=A0ABW9LK39_9MYCO